jgi:AbrB family looped-hinge helix DNA binding protein
MSRRTSTQGPYRSDHSEGDPGNTDNQIVIPSKIRGALGIKPGEKLHAIEYRGRIELVPVRPTKAARGSLKGIDTSVPRDTDRV